MKDKAPERRAYRLEIEDGPADEMWPAKIVLDGIAVAQFGNPELAGRVCG
ncbi:MAG: hypothetical protein ACREGF_00030 [Candidatus Saccharimonadales bacterium]